MTLREQLSEMLQDIEIEITKKEYELGLLENKRHDIETCIDYLDRNTPTTIDIFENAQVVKQADIGLTRQAK